MGPVRHKCILVVQPGCFCGFNLYLPQGLLRKMTELQLAAAPAAPRPRPEGTQCIHKEERCRHIELRTTIWCVKVTIKCVQVASFCKILPALLAWLHNVSKSRNSSREICCTVEAHSSGAFHAGLCHNDSCATYSAVAFDILSAALRKGTTELTCCACGSHSKPGNAGGVSSPRLATLRPTR